MQNPLLFDASEPTAELTKGPACVIHSKRNHKRDIRDLRRQQSASEALSDFGRDIEIYGFTKGQFSVIDLLSAMLEKTGPASLQVSTWTAANSDVTAVLEFLDSGKVASARWLVDLTFQRRTPELANRIRLAFGDDAIRVGKNHAKFFTLQNSEWNVICMTSMNLNFNPRFENFMIRNDPALCDFHTAMFDEMWKSQPATMANERPYQIEKSFRTNAWG